MPGTDSAEAARIVAGELTVPHIAELPGRGPGADMVGRALALVAATTGEFAAQTTPVGWRLAGGRTGADPGRQMRRGSSWLAEDLDRMEQALDGFTGTVKVQVTGPWTLGAHVESVRGTRLVADRAGCAELTTALAEAVTGHVHEVCRRLPAATVVLQVDEPGLVTVLGGRVRTASGRGAVRVPDTAEVVTALDVVRAAAVSAGAVATMAHCCSGEVPFDVLRRAGFAAVSLDATLVGTSRDEELGAWWDDGGIVVLGVVPAVEALELTADSVAGSVAALWGRIGVGISDVGPHTWLSPTCGLAGASPVWARSVGAIMRRAAGMLQSGT